MTRYPCQKKYDEKRPLITFRVDQAEKKAIEKMAKDSGNNISDLVRMALLGLEQDFTQAYNNGFSEGTEKSAIWISCHRCRNRLYIEPNSYLHRRVIDRCRGEFSYDPKCPPPDSTNQLPVCSWY